MATSADLLPSPLEDAAADADADADAFDEYGLQHGLQTLDPAADAFDEYGRQHDLQTLDPAADAFDSVDPDLSLQTLAPAPDGFSSLEHDLSLSLQTLEDLPFCWDVDAINDARRELSEEFDWEEEAVVEDGPDWGFTLDDSSDEADALAEEVDSSDASPRILVGLPGFDSSLRGALPAAISVVENLPSVVLMAEDVAGNNTTCAVCKDDFPINQSVKKLPCFHCYHEECILPWLQIRNTCPVCRFELLVVPEQ